MDQYAGILAILVICGAVFFLVALLLHLGKPKETGGGGAPPEP